MPSPNGFQNVVNAKAPPAIEGDFASVNPRASVLAIEGNLVAPATGLNVGRFAFVNPANQAVSQSYAAGYQIGFFARNAQALITAFLGAATMLVPQGFMVTLFSEGEFWARFGNGATAGQTVYADETTGQAESGAGTTSFTGSVGFTGTASFATNVMTVVTRAGNSRIDVGDVVTSAGVAGGTTITAQLTGAPGAVGSTYSLSTAPGTIATQAATTASTTLNVTAITAGSVNVGDVLSNGSTVTALGTGVGGVGTYLIAVAINLASGVLTVPAGNVQTNYVVRTNCLPGELAIISSWGF